MNSSKLKSDTIKPERNKVKKKMSKAQMQLALIKKKQCDATALLIVERLLEPIVDIQWLLENLKHINKCHMEDVIQERAIVKICGYVLCNKPLTLVFKQQYHISTKSNKVYDITRRKNFCSSSCYGACNYLLEQLLTSPLWMRENEEIPEFKLLPLHQKSAKSLPGDEVFVNNTDIHLDVENEKTNNGVTLHSEKKETTENKLITNDSKFDSKTNLLIESRNKQSTEDSTPQDIRNINEYCSEQTEACSTNQPIRNKMNTHNQDVVMQSAEVTVKGEADLHQSNKMSGKDTFITNIDTEQFEVFQNKTSTILDSLNEKQDFGLECNNVCISEVIDQKEENNKETTCTLKTECREAKHVDKRKAQDANKVGDHLLQKMSKLQLGCDEHKECSKLTTTCNEVEKDPDQRLENNARSKKDLQKKNSSPPISTTFHSLAMRVEQSFREWVTDKTLCLLQGEADTRKKLLDSMTQNDRYTALCKKLNQIQLEEERESRADLSNDSLKPLPHFSVLQEEAKKLKLKVSAFYKGSMVTDLPEGEKELNVDNESHAILPLTDAHDPKALRRRIFLDKLNKVLPDLLRTLWGNVKTYSATQYIYDSERSSLVKTLTSTFSLSATNIIFKTAEWTLVGLIIIKMLSIMDYRLKSLLATKQAVMYISMILMSYKLDENYLDRLIIELTNNPNVFNTEFNM